jgi:hypothetical protein
LSRRPDSRQGLPRANSSTTRTDRAYAIEVPDANLIPAGCSWPSITRSINLVTVANLAKKVYERIFPQLDEEERRSFVGFAEKAMNPSISSLSALSGHPFTKSYDTDKSFIRIIWLYMLFGQEKAEQSGKLFSLIRRDYPGWNPTMTWLPPHKLPATVHTSFGPPIKDVPVTEEVTGCGVDPTVGPPIPLLQTVPVSKVSRPTNAAPKAQAEAAQCNDPSSESASSKKSNEVVKSPKETPGSIDEATLETIITALSRHETLISQLSDKLNSLNGEFQRTVIHIMEQITGADARPAPSQSAQAPSREEFSLFQARFDKTDAMTLNNREQIARIFSVVESISSDIDQLGILQSRANENSLQDRATTLEQPNKQDAANDGNGNKDSVVDESALKHYMYGRLDAVGNSLQYLYELFGQVNYRINVPGQGK